MRSAVLALALLGAVSVAGCGSSTPAAAPPTPTPTPSSILEVSGSGLGVCLPPIVGQGDFGYWNGELTATQALEITAVKAGTGSGVQVRGGTGVRVVRPVTGGSAIAPWPMSNPGPLAHEVSWATRSGLLGLRMKAGETVLPIIHLHTAPGSQLDTVDVDFRTTAGQTGTAVLNVLFKHSRETC